MTLDLDDFIQRHLHSSKVINGKYVKYKFKELEELCKSSIDLLKKEGTLVHLSPPCVIVGDIHGQFYDLLRMFSHYSVGNTTGALNMKYMFLGDYVDRGRHSLECLCTVLALKLKYPKYYQVLRGNHECLTINRVYGFYDELVDRFGRQDGEKLWDHFNELFSWMPLAGLVGKKILCMHGGISPKLTSLADIDNITRPLTDVSVNPLAMDLLWSDPMDNLSGFKANGVRGVSVFFGADEVVKCLKALDIKLIVRGHQMMQRGFGSFCGRNLMTIFTAPRYQSDNPNDGATLFIDNEGRAGIRILRAVTELPEKADSGTPKSVSGSCYFGKEEEGANRKRTKRSKASKNSSKQ